MQGGGCRQCTRGEGRSGCRRSTTARIALDGLMRGRASMDSKRAYHSQPIAESAAALLNGCSPDVLAQ